MTHEYVIALNGLVATSAPGPEPAVAVGWAAEAVLAVGSNETVGAISRGDSTFLDVLGCVITPLPDDPARADQVIRESTDPGADIAKLLAEAGLLAPDSTLEAGSVADLAFWGPRSDRADPHGRGGFHLVATVRDGAFTEGDEHYGPFPAAARS